MPQGPRVDQGQPALPNGAVDLGPSRLFSHLACPLMTPGQTLDVPLCDGQVLECLWIAVCRSPLGPHALDANAPPLMALGQSSAEFRQAPARAGDPMREQILEPAREAQREPLAQRLAAGGPGRGTPSRIPRSISFAPPIRPRLRATSWAGPAETAATPRCRRIEFLYSFCSQPLTTKNTCSIMAV